MEELKVGGKWNALAGREEGTFFEITESGPMWIFNYEAPTEREVAAMSEGSPFEIRSMVRNGVLWILIKCGGEEWAEAPYNPHLSASAHLEPISDGTSGYALTLVMVDNRTCEIKHLRMIGLGNRFSKQLYASVRELAETPFVRRVYDIAVMQTQNAYSTSQLVGMCSNYWKLR